MPTARKSFKRSRKQRKRHTRHEKQEKQQETLTEPEETTSTTETTGEYPPYKPYQIIKTRRGNYYFKDKSGRFTGTPTDKPDKISKTKWNQYAKWKTSKILGTTANKTLKPAKLSGKQSNEIKRLEKQGRIRTNFRYDLYVRTKGQPYDFFSDANSFAQDGYITPNIMFNQSGLNAGLREMIRFIRKHVGNIDQTSLTAEAVYTVYHKGFFRSWRIKRKIYRKKDLLK